MPAPYKCDKGGNHRWVVKKSPQGQNYQVCAKCGATRTT